ncbi:MAG: hypothetical protein B7X04_03750 [Parcubacteria group bacterium 21-54-25]|nr:MAG: hypothetical protein B7X04_03750 [Parcubacteria group bacterium 21-54-25]HQU08269.1 hypothetical protein [Candidatus Paceibacterota bacterium]
MINLSIFKNLPRRLAYGTQLKPARDWFVVVGVVLTLLALNIVWNVINFQNIITEKTPPLATQTVVSTINQTAIEEVQQVFSTRASEQTKYESGAYTFTDPSQ